jgi:cellulose synthase (UDP-forming)
MKFARPQHEKTPAHIKALLWLFAITAIFYFHWRIYTLNPDAIIFSSLMLAAEVYGIATGIAHFMMTWRLSVRKSTQPRSGQTVDVFIPTYNESLDIVSRTIAAAVKMDYPHTTWVLDDGNRLELKKLAEELGAKYLARPSHEHAKAGNLNYALDHSSGDFIAIFDADHVPSKHFITAVLGYFEDPTVAFVQTPQDFYNLDSYQHRVDRDKGLAWTEQSLFFRVIQRGKDYWNAAFFCGSCAMVRRACLNEIGGFATDTITEDLHTSIKLHKKGYSSVYHEESLAFGIAPSTIAPFITQRIRWGQGAMQVLKKEKIFFSSGLNIFQKINYAASILTYFDGWQKGFLYITPIIVLCTGWLPISTTGTELLIHLVPYMTLNFLLTEELARGYGRTVYIEQYNMARYFAFAYATLFLIIPKKLKFKVTNKEHEQDAGKHFLWPQKFVFYANVLAVPVGIIMFQLGKLPFEGFVISVFWAFFNALLANAVLGFSQIKQSFKRSNYRFTLPNPVYIGEGNPHGRTLAIVDDISSDGCKIYGSLPASINKDMVIHGEIPLPGEVFQFSARVLNVYRLLSQSGVEKTALGCQFIWDIPEQRRKLEKFLYGSNQQFTLSRVTEKDFTPMQKALGLINSKKKGVRKISPTEWAPLVSSAGKALGAIAMQPGQNNGAYTAILNSKPESMLIQHAQIVDGEDSSAVNLKIIDIEESHGFDYSYYICDLKLDGHA